VVYNFLRNLASSHYAPKEIIVVIKQKYSLYAQRGWFPRCMYVHTYRWTDEDFWNISYRLVYRNGWEAKTALRKKLKKFTSLLSKKVNYELLKQRDLFQF
jgi:hypothetical protein